MSTARPCPECGETPDSPTWYRHGRCRPAARVQADADDWCADLRALAEATDEAAAQARGDAIRLAAYEQTYRDFQAKVAVLNPERVLFLIDRSEHLETVMGERARLTEQLAEAERQEYGVRQHLDVQYDAMNKMEARAEAAERGREEALALLREVREAVGVFDLGSDLTRRIDAVLARVKPELGTSAAKESERTKPDAPTPQTAPTLCTCPDANTLRADCPWHGQTGEWTDERVRRGV